MLQGNAIHSMAVLTGRDGQQHGQCGKCCPTQARHTMNAETKLRKVKHRKHPIISVSTIHQPKLPMGSHWLQLARPVEVASPRGEYRNKNSPDVRLTIHERYAVGRWSCSFAKPTLRNGYLRTCLRYSMYRCTDILICVCLRVHSYTCMHLHRCNYIPTCFSPPPPPHPPVYGCLHKYVLAVGPINWL